MASGATRRLRKRVRLAEASRVPASSSGFRGVIVAAVVALATGYVVLRAGGVVEGLVGGFIVFYSVGHGLLGFVKE